MYSEPELLTRHEPALPSVAERSRRWAAALLATLTVVVTAVYAIGPSHHHHDLGSLPWPSSGEASLNIPGVAHVEGPGADTAVPIASVAKVMTAYVVLRDHPLAGDGPTIVVSGAEAAAYTGQLAKGESLVKVEAGERLTERQALQALLLPSADNVAWILARWDAGGQAAFVAEMNAEAKRLGMHHTTYTDASGLAADTVSSAEDQLLLGAATLGVPALAEIVAQPTARLPVAGLVHNYNTLLGTDGIVGLKTGSTSAAGGCLLFAARVDVNGKERTIIGVVLGQPGKGRAMLTAALQASSRLVNATRAALQTWSG
jgi:serine-type D-Ala-D-Ala carboxypeptidase (penicillin-binding protein 5/6)